MTALIPQTEIRNRLLGTLAPADFALLQPHLERLSFEQRAVMEVSGERITHVYFPEPGVVSVVARTAAGIQIEAGIIGPEGMTGLALLHRVDRSPHDTFVQIPCRALRLDADALRDAIAKSRPLHDHFLRYAQMFSVQVAQTALCNGRFLIEVRLARWLLMCHDRADREDLPLTHEFLSLMLGVRRAGVTTGLQVLEAAGAIKTRRGGIGIRDRDILGQAAGDSYGPTEAEYRRVLGEA